MKELMKPHMDKRHPAAKHVHQRDLDSIMGRLKKESEKGRLDGPTEEPMSDYFGPGVLGGTPDQASDPNPVNNSDSQDLMIPSGS